MQGTVRSPRSGGLAIPSVGHRRCPHRRCSSPSSCSVLRPRRLKLVVTGIGLVGGSLAMAAGFRRRARRCTGTPAPGLDPVHHRRPARGSVQPAADHLGGVSPDPNRTPSDIALTLGPGRRRSSGWPPSRWPGDGRPTWPGWCWTASCSAARPCSSPASPLFPRILETSRRQQRVQPGGPGLRRGHRHRGDPAVPPRRTRRTGPPWAWPPPVSSATRAPTSSTPCASASTAVLHLRLDHRPGLDCRLRADRAGHLQPRAARRRRTGERPVEPSPVAGTVVMFTLFLVAAVLSLINLTTRRRSARGRPCCGWSCCSRCWPGRSC